ncbi:granulin domain-containing protein [Dictyostelium discoideum AX4]|uniref:Granulin n=1 Tax=Dictyostelium discoideum TaxID=44689 RepID=GRN_DICDI|nr:granulin domain-containing protein [Dictyostelium discoideum AX4]Q54QR7.1 RecName: Full=Granulin; Flags: Precursor [Dictyostelium discoideum]EAL65602.1 granulin domain-containing protein [Dictyostelium discoideum AX4]|eukprot:XP_638956.1 granulin domain-containing protein [Dictyostelium discoideum AX4]
MNYSKIFIFGIISLILMALFSSTVESVSLKNLKIKNNNNNNNNIENKHKTKKSLELTETQDFGSVKCPDGSLCPNSNTCCSASDGSYACCPTPNAQCCSDKQHCCPYQFTCGNGGNICKPQQGLRFSFNR